MLAWIRAGWSPNAFIFRCQLAFSVGVQGVGDQQFQMKPMWTVAYRSLGFEKWRTLCLKLGIWLRISGGLQKFSFELCKSYTTEYILRAKIRNWESKFWNWVNHRNYSKLKWLSKAIEFDAPSRCKSVFGVIVTQHLWVSHSSSLGPQYCCFSGWKRKEEVGRDLNLQKKFKLHKYKREGEVLPPLRLFFLKNSLFLTFEYGVFSGIRWLFTGTLFIVEAFHIFFAEN